MADLTRASEIHNLIVALCNQLSAEGYYFRSKAKTSRIPEPLRKADNALVVDRDRIVCALLNKAANTKVAIMTLGVRPSNRCDHVTSRCAPHLSVAAPGDGRVDVPGAIKPAERSECSFTHRDDAA